MSSSGLEDSDQGSNGENGETDSSSIAGAEISEAKTCEDSTDKGGIVTARGSGTGLIIRADGRVAEDSLRSALEDFVSSRQSFLAGNAIDIEWVGKKPAESFARELLADLKERYGVEVASSGLRQKGRKSEGASHGKQVDGQKAGSQKTASKSSSKVSAIGLVEDVGFVEGYVKDDDSLKEKQPHVRVSGVSGVDLDRLDRDFDDLGDDLSDDNARSVPGLFAGIEEIHADSIMASGSSSAVASATARGTAGRSGVAGGVVDGTDRIGEIWDDADTRLVVATLRSGQRIETEHSLVLVGDVNPGAELIAGGDIIVLGALRGIAHAGAYEESGGGRVIIALDLQPTQLRIGMVISRGGQGAKRSRRARARSTQAEVASVDGDLIVVEPFSTKHRVFVERGVT